MSDVQTTSTTRKGTACAVVMTRTCHTMSHLVAERCLFCGRRSAPRVHRREPSAVPRTGMSSMRTTEHVVVRSPSVHDASDGHMA